MTLSKIEAGDVFALTGAVPGASPFVFASPHSGRAYPPDMGARADLDMAVLRSAEDVDVDRLIAPAAADRAPLLSARIGRAYLDLNRAPDDLDPALIADVKGGAVTPRSAAGYGVTPRLSGCGQPLYDRMLTLEEARARIARVHAPYHAALERLMRAAHSRWGLAILIDWHSMPARATAGPRAGGAQVVLGDRHGSAAARALTRTVRAGFEAAGWRVALNTPYAGGYATELWGRPQDGFHALQVEISRARYMDEKTLAPTPGRKVVERVIGQVVQALFEEDWPTLLSAKSEKKAAPGGAAESR